MSHRDSHETHSGYESGGHKKSLQSHLLIHTLLDLNMKMEDAFSLEVKILKLQSLVGCIFKVVFKLPNDSGANF